MQTLVLKVILVFTLLYSIVGCEPVGMSGKQLPSNFGDDAVVSLSLSSVTASVTSLEFDATASIIVSVKDNLNNAFDHKAMTVACALTGGTSAGSFSAVTNNGDGTYSLTFTPTAAGTASTLACSLDGAAITSTAPTLTVIFTPKAIGSLVGWYDANQLSLNDSDSVATWNDLSDQGNDLTQTPGTAQPTFNTNQINSLPAVTFDGGDFLQFDSEISIQPATVFIIGKYSGTGTYPYLGNDTNNTYMGYVNGTVYYYSTVASLSVASSQPANFKMYMGYAQASGSTSDIVVDGTSVVTGDRNWGASTIAYMGRRNGERFLGQIAEVIIYSSNISLADVALVETYLGDKYGITLP